MKKHKWSLALCFKGIAMGIADVVPGVSGGTIALLLGIYESFIKALANLNHRSFFNLLNKKLDPNLSFLINLGVGIIFAILLGARVIHYFLEIAPEYVWGVFLALVIASLLFLLKKEKTRMSSWLLFVVGCFSAYFINQLSPEAGHINFFNIFIGGFFAIFAMMLPGVSGSFLLLVFGLYQHIISALRNPFEISSIKTIIIFALGALAGLMLGSRFLKKLLALYRHETLMVLLGFMLGSSPALWPWQTTSYTNSTYNFLVIIVGLLSFFSFMYLLKLADLKESQSRNKIST